MLLVVLFPLETALQGRGANGLEVVDARDHGLELRLNLLVVVQVQLVELLLVARHRAEIRSLVALPADLVVQKVLVLVHLRLLFVLLPLLQQLIELTPPILLVTFKTSIIKELPPLALVIFVGLVCIALGLLVHPNAYVVMWIIIRYAVIGKHLRLAICILQSCLPVSAYLKIIDVPLHFLIDVLVVLIAVVHTLEFLLSLVVEAPLPFLLLHYFLVLCQHFLLILLF